MNYLGSGDSVAVRTRMKGFTVGNLRWKTVGTYSPRERKLRVGRAMFERGWVSTKVAVSLVPKLAGLDRRIDELRVTLCGVQIHVRHSHGGTFC
jgi:hypothetical protein